MTLSEVSTLCPALDGMEWHEDPDFAHAFILTFADGAVYLRQPTGLAAGQWQLCAEKDDDCIVIYITVPDLSTAYLRALTAVGLAPDAEKEDMRRRLTWTSEVPTEPGVYVVGRGVKPYDGSIMFRRWDEDEGKMERPWVDAFGLPWTDEQMKGRRFFALDNLKETP